MRNRFPLALAVLAIVGLAACSTVKTLSTDSMTALKELRAVHETRADFYAKKDAGAVAAQHAPNLTAKLADGTSLDRAGFETYLSRKMQESSTVPASRIDWLSQEGANYVALVSPGLDGQGTVLRETWVKTAEGWKLKAVEALTEESAIAYRKAESKNS
ncbi:MAG TPA: hypothetical protein VNC59_00325 [Thermoanaerobaculia bacterium]|nr:hypothetical protein [Thermoanaerobaculia bacterium]